MQISIEDIQNQLGDSHPVSYEHIETALKNLKARFQKLESISDVGPSFFEGTGDASLVELIILRERNREAIRQNNLDQSMELKALADFMLRHLVPKTYNYQNAIDFLIGLGIPEPQIREWSMPQEALEACTAALKENLSLTQPLTGLQVGNCFGVSLAWFSNFIRSVHEDSLLISIDPNYSMMGGKIPHPQRLVIELLNHFDFQRNNLMVTGYSLNLNIDDWQPSCENLLPNLTRAGINQIDFVVLDGWHDHDYVVREIEAAKAILKPGGIILMDDVANIPDVGKAFEVACADGSLTNLGTPSRVGILAKS